MSQNAQRSCGAPEAPLDRRARSRGFLAALMARYQLSWPEGRHDALFASLFRDDERGSGCLFGISEFSVSLTRDHGARLRCLAETVQKRRLNAAEVQRGCDIGQAILACLSSLRGEPYAVELFREAYACIYVADVDAYPPIPFRFGVALELQRVASPTLKCYFDLHAGSRDGTLDRLASVAALLGCSASLKRWEQAGGVGSLANCRILGIDFSASGAADLKVYCGTRGLTWEDLSQAVEALGSSEHRDTFRALSANLFPASYTPDALMLSRSLRGGVSGLKLDVYLPALHPNDASACRAIEKFLDAVHLNHHGPAPIDILADGRDLQTTGRIQQYLGIDFFPGRATRVNLYYRPFGLETEHMKAHSRPALHG